MCWLVHLTFYCKKSDRSIGNSIRHSFDIFKLPSVRIKCSGVFNIPL